MTITTQAEHKQQGKSCKVLQVCKDMMQVYYGTGNCEPSPGHGRAQGWSMHKLTNKATHKDKARVFRQGSYTEHLQSRPKGKVNSSIYYKIPENTNDCKVDEQCTKWQKSRTIS